MMFILTKTGIPFRVSGYPVGPFLVHRDVRFNRRWRIAHLKSGCSCDGHRYAARKMDAVEAAEQMERIAIPGWTWDFSEPHEMPKVCIKQELKDALFYAGFKLPRDEAGCHSIPLFTYLLTPAHRRRGGEP